MGSCCLFWRDENKGTPGIFGVIVNLNALFRPQGKQMMRKSSDTQTRFQ